MEDSIRVLIEACKDVYGQRDRMSGSDFLIHQTTMAKIGAALAQASIPVKLSPMPEGKVDEGFIEIGEFDGKRYQCEGDVELLLGSDGNVYAKIGGLVNIPDKKED